MTPGLFNEIKLQVSALEAGRLYGLQFDRTGKRARCIWHSPDRHPSLSFKDGYCRCFACGHGGSAIDLTMRLFGLSPLEAARKLDADFHLGLDETPGPRPQYSALDVQKMLADWRKARIQRLNAVIAAAHQELERFPPTDAVWDDPRFQRVLAALSGAQGELARFEEAGWDELLEIYKQEAKK